MGFCIICKRMSISPPLMFINFERSLKGVFNIILKFYDCLVFSRIINSYPLVAVFEFLVVRMISIQFFCWHFVEDRRLLQGTAAGDIFCPYFSDATLLPALLQKRSEMFMLFLLGLSAIHININKDSKLSTKGYF